MAPELGPPLQPAQRIREDLPYQASARNSVEGWPLPHPLNLQWLNALPQDCALDHLTDKIIQGLKQVRNHQLNRELDPAPDAHTDFQYALMAQATLDLMVSRVASCVALAGNRLALQGDEGQKVTEMLEHKLRDMQRFVTEGQQQIEQQAVRLGYAT